MNNVRIYDEIPVNGFVVKNLTHFKIGLLKTNQVYSCLA